MGYQKHLNICLRLEEENGQKRIRVELTDPSELNFLVILNLSEKEFQTRLKKDSKLTIDFDQYPSFLTEMIEHCVESEHNKQMQYFAMLRVFNAQKSEFVIQQNIGAQVLDRVKLNFRYADSEEKNEYLAAKLFAARQEINMLKEKNTNLFENFQLNQTKCEKVRGTWLTLRSLKIN